MPPGRSSPALFELIKPGPTANPAPGASSRPTSQPTAPTTNPAPPASTATDGTPRPVATPPPSTTTSAPPATPAAPSTPVATSNIEPNGRFSPGTTLPASNPPVLQPTKVPAPLASTPPQPSSAIDPSTREHHEPDPPPPLVDDPDRMEARRAALPNEGKERWFTLVHEEIRRLLADRSTAVLIGVSIALLALISVYLIGFKVGQSSERTKADEEIKRSLGGNRPEVNDPLKQAINPGLITKDGSKPPTNNPASNPSNSSRPTTPPETKPTATKTPVTPPAIVPKTTDPQPAPEASVATSGDTRQPGLNYLQLVSKLDQSTADRLVKFLSENGLPSIAVGVDRNGKPSNNPGSYIVFAARGITGKEFGQSTGVRGEVEELAARLGNRWRSEQKGSTDFSDKMWAKYVP